MKRIWVLIREANWAKAQAAGEWCPPSLAEEGFVHASTDDQLLNSANRHHAGATDLLALLLAPERLKGELKWEASRHHPDPYPHVYGPLNLDAVAAVLPLKPGPDGAFESLPEAG